MVVNTKQIKRWGTCGTKVRWKLNSTIERAPSPSENANELISKKSKRTRKMKGRKNAQRYSL